MSAYPTWVSTNFYCVFTKQNHVLHWQATESVILFRGILCIGMYGSIFINEITGSAQGFYSGECFLSHLFNTQHWSALKANLLYRETSMYLQVESASTLLSPILTLMSTSFGIFAVVPNKYNKKPRICIKQFLCQSFYYSDRRIVTTCDGRFVSI